MCNHERRYEKLLEVLMRHLKMNVSFSELDRLNLSDEESDEGSGEDGGRDCDTLLDLFYAFYIPALIFVGLIGNILSCFVFLSSHLKIRSSSYYLAALAAADSGFLLSLLFVWIDDTTGIKVYNKDGFCQGLVYLSSVSSFLSVWLIVAFTVERFIAVQYPLHRPHMCTVERAKTIILCLVAFALLSHSYSFLTAGMTRNDSVCDMREDYADIMRIINIVDSLLTLILPLILIVFMNCMITRNLIKFNKQFRVNSLPSETSSGNEFSLHGLTRASSIHVRHHSDTSYSHETGLHRNRKFRFLRAFSSSSSRCSLTTKAQQNITKMLLVISTVFIILNLPSYVMRIYAFVFHSLRKKQPPVPVWCTQQLVMIFYYTNFSVNFLLYSMCGVTFRKCLWQMLRGLFVGHFRCSRWSP